ncbi:hypothetical protein [Chryseobacterium indologenes]|uniref:hypothetical protein n=1 Tax=Chryseobacterium indologenes TaxID=253 RepID=UPI0009A13A7C|nr:hypothetical protein [Chryseobacterium indologenes]
MDNEKELAQAKIDFRNLVIEKEGEERYYQIIAVKMKWINDFKLVGDKVFGKDDEGFRQEVRKAILLKELNDEDMLLEFVITDIALDALI